MNKVNQLREDMIATIIEGFDLGNLNEDEAVDKLRDLGFGLMEASDAVVGAWDADREEPADAPPRRVG